MRCKQFRSKFINIEPSQLDEVAFSHMDSCANCKKLYKSSLAVLNQLELAATPSFNPYFTEKVMGKLACKTQQTPSKYLSSEFAAIAIDELTLNNQDVFDFLRPLS